MVDLKSAEIIKDIFNLLAEDPSDYNMELIEKKGYSALHAITVIQRIK